MPHRLRHLLPKTAFLRKLSILASGTLAGQALIVLSSPLLTRLFTPEDFGLFAVFAGLAGITAGTVGLRYEVAVAAARTDEEAVALVMVTAVASALMAVLLTVLIELGGTRLVAAVEAPLLAFWLPLLPPAVFLWGLGSALSYWSVRRHTYKINALNRTLQFGSQAGSQVGLGLLGTAAGGLILGYLAGYVVRLGHFLWSLPANEWRLMSRQLSSGWWRRACENWRYPVFGFPSVVLQNISQHAPAILIAALYGPALAGFYALSQRIMALPLRMLGEAASAVFLGEARGREGHSLHRLFLRTASLFLGLGALGMLPILFYGPALFAFIFGEAWREAGIIVQLLVPLYLARFVVQPVSQLLYILNRQAVHLFSSSLNALALVGSFAAGHILALEALTTILLFSLASSFSYLV